MAKEIQREDSDIDIAILVETNKNQYEKDAVSPIIHQIKTSGLVV